MLTCPPEQQALCDFVHIVWKLVSEDHTFDEVDDAYLQIRRLDRVLATPAFLVLLAETSRHAKPFGKTLAQIFILTRGLAKLAPGFFYRLQVRKPAVFIRRQHLRPAASFLVLQGGQGEDPLDQSYAGSCRIVLFSSTKIQKKGLALPRLLGISLREQSLSLSGKLPAGLTGDVAPAAQAVDLDIGGMYTAARADLGSAAFGALPFLLPCRPAGPGA